MKPWPKDVQEYVDSLDLSDESHERLVSQMEWLRSLDERTHPDDMGYWAGVRPDGGPDDDVYATVKDEGELVVVRQVCEQFVGDGAVAVRRGWWGREEWLSETPIDPQKDSVVPIAREDFDARWAAVE